MKTLTTTHLFYELYFSDSKKCHAEIFLEIDYEEKIYSIGKGYGDKYNFLFRDSRSPELWIAVTTAIQKAVAFAEEQLKNTRTVTEAQELVPNKHWLEKICDILDAEKASLTCITVIPRIFEEAKKLSKTYINDDGDVVLQRRLLIQKATII